VRGNCPDRADRTTREEAYRGQRRAVVNVLDEVVLTQAKAANTVRACRSDWTHFAKWCAAQGREALPASTRPVAFCFDGTGPHPPRLDIDASALRPLAFFRNARLQPFLDQPDHSVGGYPMADEPFPTEVDALFAPAALNRGS
jgi:hypothetical protein